ncbi:MAG TPA: hypothetical protein VFX01_00670, partial [Methylophilaceae bacterium]|nr:hypothetical protein [Methylophilaceae bacterium]
MKPSDISPIDESLSIIADTAQAWAGDEFPALSDLMRAHDDHKPHLEVLVRHFTQTRHPEHELEQYLWQTVHDYLQRLDLAYASHLSASAAQSAAIPLAVLQRLQCLALLAEWHYLRYQPLTELFWRELHVAYRMAESITVI